MLMIDKIILTLFIGVLVNSLICFFSSQKVKEAFIPIMYLQSFGILILVLYQFLSKWVF